MAITFKKGEHIAIANLPLDKDGKPTVVAKPKDDFEAQGTVKYVKPTQNAEFVRLHLTNGVKLLAPTSAGVKAGDTAFYFEEIPLGAAVIDGTDATMCFHYTKEASSPQFIAGAAANVYDQLMAAAKKYGVTFKSAVSAAAEV